MPRQRLIAGCGRHRGETDDPLPEAKASKPDPPAGGGGSVRERDHMFVDC
jgi:hypothetical protein